jgi:hypothetical protein
MQGANSMELKTGLVCPKKTEVSLVSRVNFYSGIEK